MENQQVLETIKPELVLLGKNVNPAREHEVINRKFGFRVDIEFCSGRKALFRNITEVHWLYKPAPEGEGKVALESVIHSSGLTLSITEIKRITVEEDVRLLASIESPY